MEYKHKWQKDNDIIDTIKKAIETLNNKKGTKFKLLDITLKPGIDKKYGTARQLDTVIIANIKDTANNKYIRLSWYESFFNADLPDDKDGASGASRINKPEDKILLRVAYSIWSSR